MTVYRASDAMLGRDMRIEFLPDSLRCVRDCARD
jgi:hypothetical protein